MGCGHIRAHRHRRLGLRRLRWCRLRHQAHDKQLRAGHLPTSTHAMRILGPQASTPAVGPTVGNGGYRMGVFSGFAGTGRCRIGVCSGFAGVGGCTVALWDSGFAGVGRCTVPVGVGVDFVVTSSLLTFGSGISGVVLTEMGVMPLKLVAPPEVTRSTTTPATGHSSIAVIATFANILFMIIPLSRSIATCQPGYARLASPQAAGRSCRMVHHETHIRVHPSRYLHLGSSHSPTGRRPAAG